MFWRKEKSLTKVIKVNELIINMRDKSSLSWTVENWDSRDKIKPWRDFYKWFFCRSGDVFVMRYDTGEMMFRRSDIVRFDVKIRNKTIAMPKDD